MTGTEDATHNPIAEKRRQRKLEYQRLEAEARRRQEELQLEKERALKRAEDDRIAAEQRRLHEIEELRRKREDEARRIAAIEQAEHDTITGIEHQLKLLGAFCTGEIQLIRSSPMCCAVLSLASLEKPIIGVDDDVLFVGDGSGEIHSHRLRDKRCLFGFQLDSGRQDCPATSLCVARSGQLIVCREKLGQLEVFDIAQLMAMHQSAPLASRLSGLWYDRSIAITAICSLSKALPSGEFAFGGLCIDDTANEIFVTDQYRHCVQVVALSSPEKIQQSFASKSPPLTPTRSFGSKGSGRGNLHLPGGTDVSHYHVLVCDRGNHRIAVFTKRGVFVCTLGKYGSAPGQLLDPRDLRLANVRKRALTRGLATDDNAISNELFDLIVADLGNFRVQILNESGECIRVLSILSNAEQIKFHRDFIAERWSSILAAYAHIGLEAPTPHGSATSILYNLVNRLHPSTARYHAISKWYAELRLDASSFHHPFSIAYTAKDREIYVIDRQNAKLHTYNLEGSRVAWSRLPSTTTSSQDVTVRKGLSSAHSIVLIGDQLFVTDYKSHRIAVLDYPSLQFVRYIGASTYGDEVLVSYGFLPGELQHPTYLAVYSVDQTPRLLVSDSGNHCISVFDPRTGSFLGRVGAGFGHLEGYLNSPQGLAVVENRWLFVCDQLNHRVQVFDLSTGQFCRAIGHEQGSKPGEFSFPTAVAVCGSLPTKPQCNFGPHREAKYCVGDAGNHRVQVFCMETDRVLLVIDTSATPFELPMALSTVLVEQRSGCMIIADTANRSIAVFKNDGSFISAFGSNLEPENCFQWPSGAVLMGTHSQASKRKLLVLDSQRMELCTFELRDLNE